MTHPQLTLVLGQLGEQLVEVPKGKNLFECAARVKQRFDVLHG